MKKSRNSFPSFMVISLLSVCIFLMASTDAGAQSRGRSRSRSRTTQNHIQNRSSSASNKVMTTAPEWMRGVWYIPPMYKNGLRLPECVLCIVENRMRILGNTGYDPEVFYDGPFTIEGDLLKYRIEGGSYTYIFIDWIRQQLKLDEYTYITRKLTEEQLRNAIQYNNENPFF